MTPLDRQRASFERWLRYENKSEKTVTIYLDAATKLSTWIGTEHEVTDWADVRRHHIQDFIISVLQARSAGYASNLYRSLQQFARFAQSELEIPSPMVGLKRPMVPELEIPVLRDDQLQALLKQCSGRQFVPRRDSAIIYLFMDTGMRRGSLCGIKLPDLDLKHREVVVTGKGRRTFTVAFGKKAAWALDRYLDVRADHPDTHRPELWLGERGKGPLTGSGVFQMIQRRGDRLGIPGLHPHTLRHTWAHMMKRAGMSEEEMMKAADWKSRVMLNRYAASTAAERARESMRRLAPGDRL